MPNDTPQPQGMQADTETMLIEYLQSLEDRISALEGEESEEE